MFNKINWKFNLFKLQVFSKTNVKASQKCKMTQKTRNKIVIYLKRLIRIFDEYTKDKKEENIYS